MVAAGIPAAFGMELDEIPAEIGGIKFYHKTWTGAAGALNFKELASRKCNRSDFDLDSDDDSDDE